MATHGCLGCRNCGTRCVICDGHRHGCPAHECCGEKPAPQKDGLSHGFGAKLRRQMQTATAENEARALLKRYLLAREMDLSASPIPVDWNDFDATVDAFLNNPIDDNQLCPKCRAGTCTYHGREVELIVCPNCHAQRYVDGDICFQCGYSPRIGNLPSDDVPQDVAKDAVRVCRALLDANTQKGALRPYDETLVQAASIIERMEKP